MMDISQVSMSMNAIELQQSVEIAVINNVQEFTEAISQDLIDMLEVGSSPYQIDIEV